MLKKLLSREECAKCRICCCFDSSDIWEAPVIDSEKSQQITKDFKADQEFVEKDGHYLLKMKKEPNRDLYYCSLLDHEKGCIMGNEKPFDCRIWPFRIMSLNGRIVITLSPVCPVVKTRSLEDIMNVCKDISEEAFDQARRHPEYVKPYISGYPITAVEEKPIKAE